MDITEEHVLAQAPGRTRTNRWAWWGVGAGGLGIVANLVTDPIVSLTDAQKRQGPAVLGYLNRADFQIGAVAGFLAVACVLAFAAGWRQWSERHGPPASAARLVGLALTASAGAMIIGYGIKGPLAIYLPGGINAGTYPREGLYSIQAVQLKRHARQLRAEPVVQVSPEPPAFLLAGGHDAFPAGLKIGGQIRGVQHARRPAGDIAESGGFLGPEAFPAVPVAYPQDADLSASVHGRQLFRPGYQVTGLGAPAAATDTPTRRTTS